MRKRRRLHHSRANETRGAASALAHNTDQISPSDLANVSTVALLRLKSSLSLCSPEMRERDVLGGDERQQFNRLVANRRREQDIKVRNAGK